MTKLLESSNTFNLSCKHIKKVQFLKDYWNYEDVSYLFKERTHQAKKLI